MQDSITVRRETEPFPVSVRFMEQLSAKQEPEQTQPGPCSILSFSEASALRLPHCPRAVSENGNLLCPALMVVIIQTVRHVAVHLQPRFGSLKKVFKQSSPVLLEASAAGVTAASGVGALNQDSLLAAAFFRIMDTGSHRTVQSCHLTYLLFLSSKVVCADFLRTFLTDRAFPPS